MTTRRGPAGRSTVTGVVPRVSPSAVTLAPGGVFEIVTAPVCGEGLAPGAGAALTANRNWPS